MKKSLCLLAVCVLLIALFPLSAYADLLTPEEAFVRELGSYWVPILAAAVLLVALILWLVLRKKK